MRTTHHSCCTSGQYAGSAPHLRGAGCREVNKAFCGFLEHAPRRGWLHDPGGLASPAGRANNAGPAASPEGGAMPPGPAAAGAPEGAHGGAVAAAGRGVASGNWGCGAFGGDVQLKAGLQWMAATQAGRPRLLYCSFGEAKAARLQQVTAPHPQGMTCIELL